MYAWRMKVMKWLRSNWMLIAIISGVIGLGVGVFCVIEVPRWQVGEFVKSNPGVNVADRFRFVDDARRTIGQIVGGFFALMALILAGLRTWANDRNVRIIEQGHITDRYTKAIEQLGKLDGDKPNIEVRLGGIYALERIALDSPRDHWTIMEVLTAYVRSNAPAPDDPSEEGRLRTDIQAILTVLGRRCRDTKREKDTQGLDLSSTDLRGADMRMTQMAGASLSLANMARADLGGAHLERAILWGAHLEAAHLEAAHLEGAILIEAHLEGAYLREAHLEGANLSAAHLEKAELQLAHLEGAHLSTRILGAAYVRGAHLEEAYFEGAHLEGAILGGAHLEGASGLAPEQVKEAVGWQFARYSPEFRRQLEPPDLVPDGGEGADDGGPAQPEL